MNSSKLVNIIPANVINQIQQCADIYKIDNLKRLSHFLSQCAHESTGFKDTTESLYYRKTDRMIEVFKRHFDTNRDKIISELELKTAREFVCNSEKLANLVYANRMGNGDVASGDGYRYRGRGYIMLTGKSNYIDFADECNLPQVLDNPNLVATDYALLSAAWFWNKNKLSAIADTDNGSNGKKVCLSITKVVNGGTNGFDDRYHWYKNIYTALVK